MDLWSKPSFVLGLSPSDSGWFLTINPRLPCSYYYLTYPARVKEQRSYRAKFLTSAILKNDLSVQFERYFASVYRTAHTIEVLGRSLVSCQALLWYEFCLPRTCILRAKFSTPWEFGILFYMGLWGNMLHALTLPCARSYALLMPYNTYTKMGRSLFVPRTYVYAWLTPQHTYTHTKAGQSCTRVPSLYG